MITTEKALKIILDHVQNFGTEEIDFLKSEGRILKEEVNADRDFPPFNRASMDGIGIVSEEFNKGIREFSVEGIQPAGTEQLTLQNKKNCIEVMTGAICPKNVDAVVPYELVNIKNGKAIVNTNEVSYFQNIHRKGLDRKEGDVLIKKNTIISSAEIGVLATVGKKKVKIAKTPKVMIISTGDELVEVNKTPKDYQIRRSNVYTLVSLLKRLKIISNTIHLPDDKKNLKEKIEEILSNYDVLLFSGAVSKGKFDFLPEVLEELKVEKLFHRVRQRPGKPFWFGKKEKKIIFAFPGNPVSTFVNCLKYFYPWYLNSVGFTKQNDYAVLAKNFEFKPDLTYFLQVKLENNNGQIEAHPIAGHGSGDLAKLVDNDAFIELPSGRQLFLKGEVFPLISFR